MRVAIYARYSTDLQDKTSIAGQVANCEALASREGFEVVARFQDEAQRGDDDRREGYQNMLAALKRGEFTGIVCDETSRITRNPAELHRLVAELRFHDQCLITCDGIDTRSESSELVLAVKAAIDQMESRKIGYRTYRSLRERHRSGHSAGGRVYGYRSVQDGDYRRRVVDEDQAAIVREIFERFAAGEGAKTIARDLNARGVPSPGSYWNNRKRRAIGWVNTTLCGSHAQASGILRNPIYTGRHTWNKRKGKKVPGTGMRIQKRRPEADWLEFHDESLRIVSDDLWNRVQARLEKSREKGKLNGGRPARYPLSGLLTCASCGGHYVLRNGRAYCCSSHTNGRASMCTQRRTLARSQVESRLLEGIKREYLAPGVLRELTKRVQARLRELKTPDKGKLQRDLRLVERQIENVVESLSSLGMSEALTAKLRQLEADRAALKARIAANPAPPEIVPDVQKHVRSVIEGLERVAVPLKGGSVPDGYRKVDPETMHRVRTGLRGVLGEVKVIEEPSGIFAELDVGRACITAGAEERT